MAGRAAPLRASRPEEREAKGLASVATFSPLLADNAAAEATDRTRTGRHSARRRTRRSKDGPAEILFETIRDIFPELDDLLGGAALRVDLHDRTAVDHRG